MRSFLPILLLTPLTFADTIRGQWYWSAYGVADNKQPSDWITSAMIDTNDLALWPPNPPRCVTIHDSRVARQIVNIAGDTMLCSVIDQLDTFPSKDCTGDPQVGLDTVLEVPKGDGKMKGLSSVQTKPDQPGWLSFRIKKCPPRPVDPNPPPRRRRERRTLGD